MKPKRIFLSPPHMGGEELKFVHQAFESNVIAPLGEHVDGFEQDLCETTGAAHAAVLSSGTAAIHLTLIILGDDAYTILAAEIRTLFEKRLGKFSVQDFDQVAEIIRAECGLSKAGDVDKKGHRHAAW